MKRLFKFKYPKLTALVIAIITAYLLFAKTPLGIYVSNLGNLSYFGVFISGIFFSFGFSAPFSAGFFIALKPDNPILFAIIGGLGALISDMFIFSLIKVSFKKEFISLEKTPAMKKIGKLFETSFLKKIKVYLLYAFAGILIASPLPDEIGVIMLSGLTKIKVLNLAIISFVLNTIGILILLFI